MEEQQRNRTQAIEHRHSVALATGHSNSIRHIIGRFGTFLVMLGTWLEQAEQHRFPVRV
ncbi:MAG: hypothetical protein NVSMB49_27770 [Ktedonobacteraceae bacterium]